MKVFQINICPDLSTGKIMMGIAAQVRALGGNCMTASAPKNVPAPTEHLWIGTQLDRRLHIVLGKLLGCEFILSTRGTRKLIRQIKKFDPDVIHLHNLHAYYLNLPLLMEYLNTCGKKIVWTFHDCWPFTGHCPHFVMAGCHQWKTGCGNCSQFRDYPGGRTDRTAWKYQKKKEWFTALPNLTLVTPSRWLAELVQQSFLGGCDARVIHNGIDLSVYRPRDSGIREKYGCQEKYLLLGVASHWSYKKGLDVFVELACRLDDEQYQILLVGTDDNTDKQLPANIISVHRTQNQTELAEIYTAADLFVNPTREDTYPTVNMEALACGTPVLTFRTGGSPEIPDETCGAVVDCDDMNALEQEIIRICSDKPFSKEACLKRAESFDVNVKFKEYVQLYEDSPYCTERPL